MLDFNRTSILNLLQKHARFFEQLLDLKIDGQPALKNGHLVTESLQKTRSGLGDHEKRMQIKKRLEHRALQVN